MTNTTSINPSRASALHSGLKSRFKQIGGMMIESLVGLLILSVVGGGVMHATSRMANTQQQQAMNNIAVNQMRSLLMNRASANGTDLCTGQHKVKVPGQAAEVALTIEGCANANLEISNVKINGTALPAQPVSSMRPVVLEMGEDNSLIRVGVEEVANVASN